MSRSLRALIIPSAAALLLLISDAEIKYCLAAILIGLVLGIVLFGSTSRVHETVTRTDMYISVGLGIVLCAALSNVFYETWINHPYKMKDLIQLLISDYSLGLRIVSVLVSLTALPAAISFFSLLMPLLSKSIRTELLKDSNWSVLIKRFAVAAGCLILAALLGYVLLIGVYLIPVESISNNVRKSAYTLQNEGTFPELSEWCTSGLDNYTDSIMLLEAAEEPDVSAAVDAMNNPHGIIKEKDYCEILVSHYLDGYPFDGLFYYARYWHGYLIWLKPLLLLFDYSAIRLINGFVQIAMVVAVIILMWKREIKEGIIPFILCYLMLMPEALAKSFQYSSCFYAFMIGSIVLLSIDKHAIKSFSFLVFLFTGIFTAYFDFLTYPIAAFGMVALIFLLIFEFDSLEKKIADLMINGIFWCMGYGGMWAEKWILASLVTDDNIIQNALRSFRQRTGTVSVEGGAYYGVISCEAENYRAFLRTPVTLLVLAYIAVLIIRYLKKNRRFGGGHYHSIVPFLLIGSLPALWYALTLNHSTNHYWFTNKACVTTVFAILLGLSVLLRTDRSGPEPQQ